MTRKGLEVALAVLAVTLTAIAPATARPSRSGQPATTNAAAPAGLRTPNLEPGNHGNRILFRTRVAVNANGRALGWRLQRGQGLGEFIELYRFGQVPVGKKGSHGPRELL